MIIDFAINIASFLSFSFALIWFYQDMLVKRSYEWLLENYSLDHKVFANNPQLNSLKIFEENGATKFKFRKMLRKLLDSK
jgi:hypothetical protein